ncbi:hypothetical protein LX73_2495 [Fodinibius salinus]|uniref:DUF5673 domain-containing protein n=1 Tax=Fodinibius salinus TaxID=860790 RepID=A0A5D3YEA9_9BACT|nr:hypothetical protein [Fodinibius salinus]TYP91671.1 hypothetical protein LX73_2495 [Fodinibius salinus]
MLGTELNIIFWFILGAFTLGAAVMATAALVNVIRLRNVRISWKAGKLWGYPLFSTLFLSSVLLVGVVALRQGGMEEIIIAGVYGWLGFCWFSTSLLATKRFITDYGIVKNANEPSQTVAWHQIRDFVVKEQDDRDTYIFIYTTDEMDEHHNLIRLELDVPHGKKELFENLISHKLGRRIRCYVDSDINVGQFE